MMSDLKTKVANEASRIEEDVDHSARSHFNAGNRWKKYHYTIGLPSALAVALSGGAYIGEETVLALILAAVSTALTTTLTFLKPSEKSELHKSAGNQYLKLRNQTRIFREIDLEHSFDEDFAKKRIKELGEIRDDLNQNSPSISRKDYDQAKKDIDEGRSTHRIDTKE
ncbi:MAG: SLATT domain-containing protein [Gracilimonas sp.]|uniref:SLATT domain-containing protein n=2 Tax=Gracilimonas sp. TaxID=1974203 RepID=UPI001B06C49C|nr:SLATT domain-containing protein [Gracilimonas sp.]MBO6584750.1 SLATT domain-containing protein [Gracilimonas sp.]MBO6615979.1 SLATT domain-containing protein [Gracilimonas sp.]